MVLISDIFNLTKSIFKFKQLYVANSFSYFKYLQLEMIYQNDLNWNVFGWAVIGKQLMQMQYLNVIF